MWRVNRVRTSTVGGEDGAVARLEEDVVERYGDFFGVELGHRFLPFNWEYTINQDARARFTARPVCLPSRLTGLVAEPSGTSVVGVGGGRVYL